MFLEKRAKARISAIFPGTPIFQLELQQGPNAVTTQIMPLFLVPRLYFWGILIKNKIHSEATNSYEWKGPNRISLPDKRPFWRFFQEKPRDSCTPKSM